MGEYTPRVGEQRNCVCREGEEKAARGGNACTGEGEWERGGKSAGTRDGGIYRWRVYYLDLITTVVEDLISATISSLQVHHLNLNAVPAIAPFVASRRVASRRPRAGHT